MLCAFLSTVFVVNTYYYKLHFDNLCHVQNVLEVQRYRAAVTDNAMTVPMGTVLAPARYDRRRTL